MTPFTGSWRRGFKGCGISDSKACQVGASTVGKAEATNSKGRVHSSSVAPEFAYSYGTLLSNTALDDTQNQCDWHGAEGPAQRLLWLPSSTAPTQSPCWLRLETGYLSLVP